MTTTRVKELIIDFRSAPIRIFDIEYVKGSLGEYLRAPEDCYESESVNLDYQVDSGSKLLNALLEDDLRDEITRSILHKLKQGEYI